VATLAAKFAANVPDGLYSMAVYQAHLMRCPPLIEYLALILPILYLNTYVYSFIPHLPTVHLLRYRDSPEEAMRAAGLLHQADKLR
jgi:hypothetical protein